MARVFEGVVSWPFPRPAARGLVELRRDGGADGAGAGEPEYLFVHVGGHDGDTWVLPGGAIESGEEPQETVAREVREETGLDVAVGEAVDAYSFESVVGEHVATVFRCTDPEGEVTLDGNPDSEPIDEVRWVPASDVGELTVPEDLAAVLERVVDDGEN